MANQVSKRHAPACYEKWEFGDIRSQRLGFQLTVMMAMDEYWAQYDKTLNWAGA